VQASSVALGCQQMLLEPPNHGRWVSTGFLTVCLAMDLQLVAAALARGPAVVTLPEGGLVAEVLVTGVLADGDVVVAGALEVASGLCLGLAATVLQVLCLCQL